MIRKIFIGIPFSGGANVAVNRHIHSWGDIPVSWTQQENRHITLSFLGHVDDMHLLDIGAAVSAACEGHEIFDVLFSTITVGPSQERPKMIWLSGSESEELMNLQSSIHKNVFAFAKAEKKRFRPHVTLGRVQKEFLEERDRHKDVVETSVSIPLEVSTVILYESTSEEGQRKYIPLDVFDLGASQES